MNFNDLFEAPFGEKFRKFFKQGNIKPLNPNDRTTPATVSDKDVMAMNKPKGKTYVGTETGGEPTKQQPTYDQSAIEKMQADMDATVAASNKLNIDVANIEDLKARGLSDEQIAKLQRIMQLAKEAPKSDPFKDIKMTHVSGPSERGTRIFGTPETMAAVRQGRMTPQRLVADLVYNKMNQEELYADHLARNNVESKDMFELIDANVDMWWDDELPDLIARNTNLEHWEFNGKPYYVPSDTYINDLTLKYVKQLLRNSKYKKESINESVDTHDKLVATVANYMYVKHPEIFTQHGDGYVMTVVDDVVSKWEQQDEPMQDIKAYALEVMDALGADRTNEAIATIKTDYKGHHLMNADGEEVQSYPKNVEGLKKARNTLYINNKGLNTMKQEGLNEAFEAALEKLSLNESVTINTTSSSEGEDTVTVTATAEDAMELVALLKAAGLPHKADEVQAQIVASPCGEQVEEELANEPNDEIMGDDMDHMNTQSGGLNRCKMQQKYANPLGDNPLAESDDLLRGLWDLYKEAK